MRYEYGCRMPLLYHQSCLVDIIISANCVTGLSDITNGCQEYLPEVRVFYKVACSVTLTAPSFPRIRVTLIHAMSKTKALIDHCIDKFLRFVESLTLEHVSGDASQ